MAKVVRFSELPIVSVEPGDTLTAYREGSVVRIPVPVPDSGGVTSVGVSMPAGFQIANSPITSSGTITVTFAEGYGLPTTAAMGQWSTAYSWGDHSQAGYALASSLGTAASRNVPESGNAGNAEVVLGNDSRLSDARAPTAHTHSAGQISGLANVATSGDYNDLDNRPPIPAGTVTSVGVSVPTGLSVSNSPVTDSGTIAISYASGYSIPTTAKQGQWDSAYSWGNHASAGYVTSAALQAYTYDKATIDSKIADAGGEETYPYRGNLGTSNLNDVREPGLWGQAVHADATLARNYPFEGVPGALEVLTLNPDTTPFAIVTQRYTTNEGNQRIAIRRGGAQGGWNAWREIPIGSRVWQSATTALTKNTAHKIDFSSPRMLTLPASPLENDYVEILRLAGSTANSTVARNGQTIMGLAENLTLDVDIQYIRLDFVNSSWRIAS